MSRTNQIAESFLDGFGSLSAIFEPAVRPGSLDNLIQEDWAPPATGSASNGRADRWVSAELIWCAMVFFATLAIHASLSSLPAFWWVEFCLRASDILAIMAVTLFFREAVRASWKNVTSRSKADSSAGAKAPHGV